jgi:hypothetical protein
MCNAKTNVIPVIIGATGTISKSFRKHLSYKIKELQKTAYLDSRPKTHDVYFCWRVRRSQGHITAARNTPMKNIKHHTGNETHDLPTCSAMPKPTALPRTSYTDR